ncbi:MAG TPA: hypothetical protein PKA02_01450 [Candidatus Saccharibacteria bacterium]|nr:hypothetical protein [Candidatus Saccharibacteria bacterium]
MSNVDVATPQEEFRIGVLASGGGTTFEALQQSILDGQLVGVSIEFVICNNGPTNPDAGVWGRAERLGVPTYHVSNTTQKQCTLPETGGTISYEASEKIVSIADSNHAVHMLVTLGYMKRLIGDVLEIDIANTHPGPLGPDRLTAGFHGDGVQEEVMRKKLPYSGPTFHWLSKELDADGLPAYDMGPEIGHEPVAVTDEMRAEWEEFGTVKELKAEVMRVEKLWVPAWVGVARDQVLATA